MCCFAIKKTQIGVSVIVCVDMFDFKANKIFFFFSYFRPLDEAKKVKDKFDDIFNTTR